MKSILLFIYLLTLPFANGDEQTYGKLIFENPLTPYVNNHGSKLSHQSIQECHKEEFGIQPHELYVAHNSGNLSAPFVKVMRFVKNIGVASAKRTVRGHFVVIPDSLRTLSVLEPDEVGGCARNIRQTVSETSKKHKCLAAINAGYFDTKDGKCLGNVISDNQLAHDSNGVQNVHFGLTNDGQIFTGYLSHEQVLSGNMKQLVGGVVWILRNGTGFVNVSKRLECEETEETGPMDRFVTVRSARTAVGHDKEGNVIFVQIDGKTDVDGLNLYEMEVLLQSFGLINAINLDGGGSSTLVLDGVTANYPYDQCEDKNFNCDRKVSTVLCAHSPYCSPKDCSSHGTCTEGECICETNWLPPKCDQLFCGKTNCSDNGVCIPEGCICHPGFFGEDCDQNCPEGFYGSNCLKRCDCLNSRGCNSKTGSCVCKSGYTGDKCQIPCTDGFFGENCELQCQCDSSCYCDPFTGACDIHHNTSLYKITKCLAEEIILKRNLVKSNPDEKRKWIITMLILGIITSICLASFLIILCCSCSCYCKNDQILCFKKTQKQYKKYRLQMPGGYISDSLSDSETHPMKTFQKT